LFDLAAGCHVREFQALFLEGSFRIAFGGIQALSLTVVPAQVILAASKLNDHFGDLAVGPLFLDFCAQIENNRSISQTLAPFLDRRKLSGLE
jgi:hypothetical protein